MYWALVAVWTAAFVVGLFQDPGETLGLGAVWAAVFAVWGWLMRAGRRRRTGPRPAPRGTGRGTTQSRLLARQNELLAEQNELLRGLSDRRR